MIVLLEVCVQAVVHGPQGPHAPQMQLTEKPVLNLFSVPLSLLITLIYLVVVDQCIQKQK